MRMKTKTLNDSDMTKSNLKSSQMPLTGRSYLLFLAFSCFLVILSILSQEVQGVLSE